MRRPDSPAAERGMRWPRAQVMNEEDVKRAFPQVQGEVPGSPVFAMKLAPASRHLEARPCHLELEGPTGVQLLGLAAEFICLWCQGTCSCVLRAVWCAGKDLIPEHPGLRMCARWASAAAE